MRSFSHPPLHAFLLLRSPKSVSSFSFSPSIRPRLLLLKRDRSNPSFLNSFSLLAGADLKCPPTSLRSDLFSHSARAGMASVVGEGSVAARLWIASSKEALLGSYTPFVVLLTAGTLDMDTFRRYIAQDAYFLRAFAQAYEMAAECADDDDAKDTLSELRKDALDELKMHDSVMQDWGIDPIKEIIPNPATLKYTEFLLATAAGKIRGEKGHANIVTPFEKTKIAAYTVGAMTPCMRLYAFLGKELQSYLKAQGNCHPYKKWIDTYSSTNFEESAMRIEDLLDKLSVSLTGGELEIMEKLYCQAMKLEVEFFNAQSIVQPVVVPFTKVLDKETQLVIFFDFDLTCTMHDSCAILAELAILTASKVVQSDTADTLAAQKSPSDMRNTWDILSKQYAEEDQQCIESLLSAEQVETFDYESLCKSIEKLSDFEKRANSRAIQSGLLKGLNLEDIKRNGERLILQDGCKDFFQKVITIKENFNADFHILSFCWCADLIRSSIASVGCLNDLSIHANEFNYEESLSTGEIIRTMESPTDKVNKFRSILSRFGNEKKQLSIYIGDSVGDLLCLLEADVGIVIGSNSSLRRIGEKFGVSFTPLRPAVIKKQMEVVGNDSNPWKGLSGILYTASSWTEVHAFILGA